MKTHDLNDQIIEVFTSTTQAERVQIAKAWVDSYASDLSEYVTRTGLPPIALIVASLIDTDHPLLVSPGRGVMYPAVLCALIVLGLELNQVAIGSTEAAALIIRITRKFRVVENCGKVPKMPVDKPVEDAGTSGGFSTPLHREADLRASIPQDA
jgi:hypothetical protein